MGHLCQYTSLSAEPSSWDTINRNGRGFGGNILKDTLYPYSKKVHLPKNLKYSLSSPNKFYHKLFPYQFPILN